jgi:poly(A) polymerase/tRNA nucleotidyltransferase (CCA-adding enzyme)
VTASPLDDPALAPILAALPNARLVGGCVRDWLAGRPVTDTDLATPEPPESVLAALQAANLRAIPTGLAHGTITAISKGCPFEITTLRRDIRTDGRHAEVAWTDDWQQDAARRDFTINAMSLDRTGHLHDYFAGAADLSAGRVRFVGEAGRRIAEDYLRVLRFFRFHARYGRGEPDADAAQAISASTNGLGILSPERVWSELKRILALPDPIPTLSLMHRLGVLEAVLSEARDLPHLSRLVEAGAPPDPLLRLAALLTGDPNALAARLRLANAERDRLAQLKSGPVPSADDDDATLRRLLADEPTDLLVDRTWLQGIDGSVRRRLSAQARPVFPLEGRDALALGMTPGPGVGLALAEIRRWWLERGCIDGRAECLAQLHERKNLLF